MTDAAPEPSTRRRNGEPGLSRWSWPTTSSSERGRIRTASGALAVGPDSGLPAGSSPADRSNRPSDTVQAYHGAGTLTIPVHETTSEEQPDVSARSRRDPVRRPGDRGGHGGP